MTREEVETECDFVMGVIEKEHRQPTFDDAIKYGMRLQKKQMMAKAIDGEILEMEDYVEQLKKRYLNYEQSREIHTRAYKELQ